MSRFLPWHVDVCCVDRFSYEFETDGCTTAYLCPECPDGDDLVADLIDGAEP